MAVIGREFVIVALEWKQQRQRKCILSPLHGMEKDIGYSSPQTMHMHPEAASVAADGDDKEEENDDEEEGKDARFSASLSRQSAVFCNVFMNSKCSQNMVKYLSN